MNLRAATFVLALTSHACAKTAPDPSASTVEAARVEVRATPNADAATVPPPNGEPVVASKPSSSPKPGCIVATYRGPVGNCLEPSLVIEDSCARRAFVLHFDDCAPQAKFDEKKLTVIGPRLIGAEVRDLDSIASSKVVDLRGSIRRDGENVVSRTDFDLEVDFSEAGRIDTVHLAGVSQGERR